MGFLSGMLGCCGGRAPEDKQAYLKETSAPVKQQTTRVKQTRLSSANRPLTRQYPLPRAPQAGLSPAEQYVAWRVAGY